MNGPGHARRQSAAGVGPDPVIDSWKGIAAHFGVTVRTVQLWERENGLPVYRQPGIRGRVFAYASELEAWRAPARPAAPPPAARSSVWLRAALASAFLLLCAALIVAYRQNGGVPALHRIEGPFLVVLDGKGSELWRHRLPAAPSPTGGNPSLLVPPVFADLDGDSSVEVVYPYHRSESSDSDELICFNSAGRPLWRFTPGREVATASQRFTNHYRLRSVTLLPREQNQPARLLVNSMHEPDYPTQLVTLDAQGRIRSEYWHSGHLVKTLVADLDSDGASEILLAGIVNGARTADLVVLDAAAFSGASSEDESAYQIRGMPLRRERARLLFPRSSLNRHLDHYPIPTTLILKGTDLLVQNAEFTSTSVGISIGYVLTRELRLNRVEFSDGFLAAHNALRAQGILPAGFVPDTVESFTALRYLRPFVPRPPRLARSGP